jgi:hypothetical protein
MKTLPLLLLLTSGLPSPAAVIHWTNTSNGNWSVAANWNPNQSPSTNDIAVITNAGNYVVTLNSDPTIAGLIVGGETGTQTVATAGNTLTLNGDGLVNTNGRLLLSGGAISGTNRVNVAGQLTWQSGVVETHSAVVVTPGGQVLIASAGNNSKVLSGSLTNDGVITWQSYGSLDIGGTLHNRAGALFDAQVNNRSIRKSGDQAVFINEGEFRKSTSSSTVSCAVPLLNRGTVDNQLGTLTLLGGSELDDGSIFIGAGQTRLEGGTNILNGDLFATNVVLVGTTLVGTGTLSGVLTWDSGTIGSGAAITVAANGHLLISSAGNNAKFLLGNLTNAGTVTFSTYGTFNIGGTFHNLAGAMFDVQTDNRSIEPTDPAAIIVNDGVIRRAGGTGTVSCSVATVNHGTVEGRSGTLAFNGSFTNTDGTIALAGGSVALVESLVLASGLLTGWGTLNADVINAACVRPARSNGVLTIKGEYEQRLGGRLEFELSGNVPGTNQSRLAINGPATLRGTVGVHWAEGYVPSPGTNFSLITFVSHQGEFCCFDNCILLGQGRRLEPVYSATNLTLATVNAPEPTTVPLRVTVDGDAIACWPVEFPGYVLYWSTSLNQTGWILAAGATNRLLDSPPLASQKFFRLHKP